MNSFAFPTATKRRKVRLALTDMLAESITTAHTYEYKRKDDGVTPVVSSTQLVNIFGEATGYFVMVRLSGMPKIIALDAEQIEELITPLRLRASDGEDFFRHPYPIAWAVMEGKKGQHIALVINGALE